MSTRALQWAVETTKKNPHIGLRPRRLLIALAALADELGSGQVTRGELARATGLRTLQVSTMAGELVRRRLIRAGFNRAGRDVWMTYALCIPLEDGAAP